MKLYNEEDLDNDDKKIFRNYFYLHEKIQTFINNATNKTFDFLFEEDGERLWKHYVLDCERELHKFRTYLTRQQINTLLINIHLNDNILAIR